MGRHVLDAFGYGQGRVAGSFECGNQPSGIQKLQGISSNVEDMLASQESLCYTQ